jgi:putative acetyltransferase
LSFHRIRIWPKGGKTANNGKTTGAFFWPTTKPFYTALINITYFAAPKKSCMPALDTIRIRTIRQEDNKALAAIIRKTLEEFGANRPGTVYFDPTTDALYELFRGTPGSVYFVAETDEKIVGGGGIFPSPGLPQDTCELVKMYLLPDVRGIGLGKKIIEACIGFAKESGYSNIYIETMPELKQAMKTYEKFGFAYLDGPLGETGHFGCDMWMLKRIEP